MPDTGTERRKNLRIPFQIDVSTSKSRSGFLQTYDISSYGMFVKTDAPLPIDSKVFVSFNIPGNPIPIKSYARVAWVNSISEDKTKPEGMGIQFLSLSEFDIKRLDKFLDTLYEESDRQGSTETLEIDSENFTLFDFSPTIKESLDERSKKLLGYINDMKSKGSHTYRRQLISSSGNRVTIFDETVGKEREMIMMGSNNYLGLSAHPRVVKAAEDAIAQYGVGAGSVSLLAGTFDLHKKLEKKLAELKGTEDAIIFPSGYSTNVGCLSAILRDRDLVALDRLAHASIIDGSMLSNSKLRTFKHSDMKSLNDVMERNREIEGTKLIAVDGVYSMDGDIAPLPEIVKIAKEHKAMVMVDDAHATGVIGKMGKGTTSHFDLEGEVDIIVGTLSKAVGQLGGFVASSREIVNYMRYFARSYFFSTSLPPVVVASVLAAIEVMETEPHLHKQLWDNIDYFKGILVSLGFEIVENTQSAIIPVIVGEERLLKKMSARLHEEGIYVNPVPYPAVPRTKTRFRISIMATHTREDLDTTLEVFEKVGREFGIIGQKRTIINQQ